MSTMRTMQSDRVDLNLLRVLDALLQTQSVGRTAEALSLSQPAASRAVTRLRKALGDPLLVRTRSGYVLTPRAAELRATVRTALEQVAGVFDPAAFDPARDQRHFRIGSTDYGSAVVLPGLVAGLLAAAPASRLSARPWSPTTLEDLEAGRVDCALYADEALPPDFHTRDLFTDRYVAIVRAGHPATLLARGQDIDPAALAAWPQLAPSYPSGRLLVPDDLLARAGVAGHRIAVDCPYFVSLPWLIGDTDLVLLAPSRLVLRCARAAGLATIELATRFEFTYRLVWHERAHRDGAVQWLRARVVDATTPATTWAPPGFNRV